MSAISKRVMWTFSFVVLAAGAISLAGIGVLDAQEARSPEQIIRALKPAARTRSLSMSPAETSRAVEEKKFIDGLRGRQTRSLSTDEKDKITTIAQKKPNIDLEINFDYNSAKIASSAMPQVTALGQAL